MPVLLGDAKYLDIAVDKLKYATQLFKGAMDC